MFKVWSKMEAMPYLWQNFAALINEVKHIAAGSKVPPFTLASVNFPTNSAFCSCREPKNRETS